MNNATINLEKYISHLRFPLEIIFLIVPNENSLGINIDIIITVSKTVSMETADFKAVIALYPSSLAVTSNP